VVAICTIAATGRAEGLGPLGTAAETMANVAIRAVEADDQGIAFVHVNVVPMTAERVDYHQTVLVTGGEITAVGPSHEVEVPENTTVIDGDGAYLMPGLADMHVHTREDWMGSRWPARPLEWCQVQGY
jgi:cytosine/adenosine deaminase-related metal-dependent hydrolase